MKISNQKKKKSPTYVAVVIRKLNYAAATTVNNNSIFAMSFDVTAVVTIDYQTETQKKIKLTKNIILSYISRRWTAQPLVGKRAGEKRIQLAKNT